MSNSITQWAKTKDYTDTRDISLGSSLRLRQALNEIKTKGRANATTGRRLAWETKSVLKTAVQSPIIVGSRAGKFAIGVIKLAVEHSVGIFEDISDTYNSEVLRCIMMDDPKVVIEVADELKRSEPEAFQEFVKVFGVDLLRDILLTAEGVSQEDIERAAKRMKEDQEEAERKLKSANPVVARKAENDNSEVKQKTKDKYVEAAERMLAEARGVSAAQPA